jgi:hypothetical protein
MKRREAPPEHPLVTAAFATLVIVLTAGFLAAFVWLMVRHTLVLFALVALLALAKWASGEVAVRRFARANEGRTFLLLTRRHGWYDFVTNNVEPVLPEGWEIVWYARPRFQKGLVPHPLQDLLRWRWRPERPAAVRVRGRRIEQRSLRRELQPLKLDRGVQRDPAIQAEVRRILEHAF